MRVVWSLGYWDRGFESNWRHGCLSSFAVLYCPVEVEILRRTDPQSRGTYKMSSRLIISEVILNSNRLQSINRKAAEGCDHPLFIYIFYSSSECRSRVANTVSHSGCLDFKPLPGDRLSWLRFFVVLLSTPMQVPDSTLNYTKTVSFHILSKSSFTYHPFIWRCIVWVTE
jgi:hypothetical protein